MVTQFTCPLCGHGFDPAAHLACQTCPLHTGCHLVCCPSCGHTTVDQGRSRIVRWITTLLDRTLAQPHEPATSQHSESTHQCALADVPLAGWARVLDVSGLAAAQGEQLHGYGILPGCVLRVIQRTPVTLVQIGHTELALETETARAIWVDALG